jgi:polysaccharide biosynthesis transport protein
MAERSVAQLGSERSYLDLVDYLRILRRRKSWVLIAVAVGIVIGLAHFALADRRYVSTARVLVEETNVNPLEGQSPVDLETEREVVLSTPVARIAGESLGSDRDPSELLRQVSVDVPGETQVLEIGYDAGSPRAARDGAVAFAQAYLDYRREQADAQLDNQTEQIRSQMGDLLARIGELALEIETAPLGSEDRARDVATRNGLKAQVEALQGQLAALEAVNTDPGEVIGAPATPRAPASPSLPIDLALGLAGGLLVGAVLGLFRERTDPRVHGHLDLEKVMGVPTLAFVPPVEMWTEADDPVLISRDAVHDPAAEGYRLLRTHVLLAAHLAGGGPQVLLVTSALPGEGKTTTVANLGVVLSHSDQRTILVSADFRRPRLHRFFGLRSGPGLSDVLAGTARLRDALQDTDVEHLSVLGSGQLRTAAVELLRPVNIQELVRECVEELGGFDFLVIDAPPLLPVADTLAMVSAVDNVIFVVDANRTGEPALARSREMLEQVDAQVLGTFLNNYRPPAEEYPAYGYEYGPVDDESRGLRRLRRKALSGKDAVRR